MRQSRNYGALNETHRQIDEQQNAAADPAASRQPRNYGALHETQHRVDDQRQEEQASPQRPLRSWTHHGGMVPQQGSANDWIEQNHEIRMSDSNKSGPSREGEKTQSSPDQQQNDPELQEARAAIEEARRRETAERTRQQERDRSGPER